VPGIGNPYQAAAAKALDACHSSMNLAKPSSGMAEEKT